MNKTHYCHQIRSLPISRTRMRFTPTNTQNRVRRHLHNIRIRIRYAHRTQITRKKDRFEEEKFVKIKPKQITSEHTRYEDEENKQYYYGFVNENTHMNMKMDLYMSNIYSRISLQAIEFHSKICAQTRNIR